MKLDTLLLFVIFYCFLPSIALSEKTRFQTSCAAIGGEEKEGLCYCKKKFNALAWHKEGTLRFPFFQICKKNHKKNIKKKPKLNKWASERLSSLHLLKRIGLETLEHEESILGQLNKCLSQIAKYKDLKNFQKILEERRSKALSLEPLKNFLQIASLGYSGIFTEESVNLAINLFVDYGLEKLDDQKRELLINILKKEGKTPYLGDLKNTKNWDLTGQEALVEKALEVSVYSEEAYSLVNLFDKPQEEQQKPSFLDTGAHTVEDLESYDKALDSSEKRKYPSIFMNAFKRERTRITREHPLFLQTYYKLGFPSLYNDEKAELLEKFPDLVFSEEDTFFIQLLQKAKERGSEAQYFYFRDGLESYFALLSLLSKKSELNPEQKEALKLILTNLFDSSLPLYNINKILRFHHHLFTEILRGKSTMIFLKSIMEHKELLPLFFLKLSDLTRYTQLLESKYAPILTGMLAKTTSFNEKMILISTLSQIEKNLSKKFKAEVLLKEKEFFASLQPKSFYYFLEKAPTNETRLKLLIKNLKDSLKNSPESPRLELLRTGTNITFTEGKLKNYYGKTALFSGDNNNYQRASFYFIHQTTPVIPLKKTNTKKYKKDFHQQFYMHNKERDKIERAEISKLKSYLEKVEREIQILDKTLRSLRS